MSPIFKALKEHEESIVQMKSSPQELSSSARPSPSSSEQVVISPSTCSVRRPVRNLNKEFVMSPLKQAEENLPPEKKILSSEAGGSETGCVDVNLAFGMYVAEEMRLLNNEKAVRSLKKKIMKAILDVQTEQENKK